MIQKFPLPKRKFNPGDPSDRKIAQKFLECRSWNIVTRKSVCPFECEWPYLDIPSMLKDKLLKHYFKQA